MIFGFISFNKMGKDVKSEEGIRATTVTDLFKAEPGVSLSTSHLGAWEIVKL